MRISKKQARKLGIDTEKPKSKKPPVKKVQHDPFVQICCLSSIGKPIKEFAFAKGLGRKWRFDYLFRGKYALEVEGGIFGVGKPCPACGRKQNAGHTSAEGITRDIEKYNTATFLGYEVYRVLPEDLKNGKAIALIARAILGNQFLLTEDRE